MSRTDASRTASRSRAAAYVALTKPRIIELLLITTLPTMVVAQRGLPSGWLKRTSSQNIVIGGAAGAVPVLVGWASVRDSLSLAPVVLFAVIFVWTPPHFWALAVKYRDDYAAADVPMLPVVASLSRTARRIVIYTIALWFTSLLFAPVAGMGLLYTGAAVILGAVFVLHAL